MQESHGVGGESARESGEGPGNALRTHTGAGVREQCEGVLLEAKHSGLRDRWCSLWPMPAPPRAPASDTCGTIREEVSNCLLKVDPRFLGSH